MFLSFNAVVVVVWRFFGVSERERETHTQRPWYLSDRRVWEGIEPYRPTALRVVPVSVGCVCATCFSLVVAV